MTELVPPDHESARPHRPPPRPDQRGYPDQHGHPDQHGRPGLPGRGDPGDFAGPGGPPQDAVERLRPAGNRAIAERFRHEPQDRHMDAPASLRERAGREQYADLTRVVGEITAVTVAQARAWRGSAPSRDSRIPAERPLSMALSVLTSTHNAALRDLCYSAAIPAEYTRIAEQRLADPAEVAECARTFDRARNCAVNGFFDVAENDWTAGEAARETLKAVGATALENYLAGIDHQVVRDQEHRLSGIRRWSGPDPIDGLCVTFVLEAMLRALRARPQVLDGGLSTGYLRLLDETAVWTRMTQDTGEYGSEVDSTMGLARATQHELDGLGGRLGTVRLTPAAGQNIGHWSSPALGFGAFTGTAAGVYTAGLGQVAGTRVRDLPLTLGFAFQVASPYTRPVLGRGTTEVTFTRRPDGQVTFSFFQAGDSQEWLASYASGISRELTDEERFHYAPLGAEKLYAAIKDKPVVLEGQDG